MTPIKLLRDGIDVGPLRSALREHPALWDQVKLRTAPEASPHRGLSDIWVRYADPATWRDDGYHDSIWYPAADVLPVRDLVYPLMSEVHGMRLGGVLITRIKPGQFCRPHRDLAWHAQYYDKFAIQVEAAPKQSFNFDGASLVTKPGDLFWFDNSHLHWVLNDSDVDRITLIVCIQVERPMKNIEMAAQGASAVAVVK